MKHIIRLAAALGCLALGIPEVWASCETPHSYTIYYFQRHTSCGPPDAHGFRICNDYWSQDGECLHDCDGSIYCSGDTQMRSYTMTEMDGWEACAPVCD